ncbi:hypothetical protein ADL19_14725 [Streptomyces purpurogeneiscleroticus]|nr:hypothetical protein ADL19_14725 [Streptomyces purpurogeneiscleroticus]
MSWFRRKPETKRAFRLHHFKPTPDISAFELATITANVWSFFGASLSEGLYLPAERTAETYFRDEYEMPELARHFEPTNQVDEFPASWF